MSKALEAIYAKIPDAGCKGLCAATCAAILCSDHERAEIKRWSGKDIMGWAASPLALVLGVSPCAFLLDGKCSIYSMRPAICRLFGAVDHELLRCRHGCAPEKPLTNAESRSILEECEAITSTR